MKSDPIAKKRTVVTTVPEECENASVAWSPDGAKAVLWFPSREGEGEMPRPRLREITIATGDAQPVEIPSMGSLSEIAYDPRGALIALTETEIPEKELATGQAVFDGSTFAIPREMDGLPILVHAWRRESAGWKRFETKVSDTGWDLATGVRALAVAGTLGVRSGEVLDQSLDGENVRDKALNARLDAAAGAVADDEFTSWTVAKTPLSRDPVYVLQEETEFVIPLATIVFGDAGKLVKAPDLGIPGADPVAIQLQGPWMLVTRLNEGSAPHLYDLRTRTLAWRSDTAHVTTFWPE